MRWILLDVVLALLALGVLGLVGLSLWRRVQALGSAVGAAGSRLAQVSAQLEAAQLERQLHDAGTFPTATPAGHVVQAPKTPRGVRSTRPS